MITAAITRQSTSALQVPLEARCMRLAQQVGRRWDLAVRCGGALNVVCVCGCVAVWLYVCVAVVVWLWLCVAMAVCATNRRE